MRHTVEMYEGVEMCSLITNLYSRHLWVVSLMPHFLYLPGSCAPFYSMLSGYQRQSVLSGEETNLNSCILNPIT
jgi:hypothetical protein